MALRFSGGGDDRVTLGTWNFGAGVSTMTMGCWFRKNGSDDFTSYDPRLISKQDSYFAEDHYAMLGFAGVSGSTYQSRSRLLGDGSTYFGGDRSYAGTNGEWHHIVVRYTGSNVDLFTDGVEDSDETYGASGSFPTSGIAGATWAIGNGDDGSDSWSSSNDGDIADAFCTTEVLTGSQIAALASGMPFARMVGAGTQFYLPLHLVAGSTTPDLSGRGRNGTLAGTSTPSLVDHPPLMPMFGWLQGWRGRAAAAGGGGVTVAVPLGTFGLSGTVPSIATGTSVAVPAGSYALSGQVPSIATGAAIGVPAGVFSLGGQVPSIETGVAVAVPAGSFALTGQVPSVETGIAVAVPLGTFALTGFAPSLDQGVTVAVPLQALSLAGQVPSIETGAAVAVPVKAFSLAGQVPAVGIGSRVTVPAGAFSLSGAVPAMRTGAAVAVPLGTFDLVGLVPSIATGVTVAVPLGTFDLVGLLIGTGTGSGGWVTAAEDDSSWAAIAEDDSSWAAIAESTSTWTVQ